MAKAAEVYSLTESKASPMNDPEAFLKDVYSWIKDKVHAKEKVGLAVSGGIDSSVVAQILRDSIGENLYPIHMDHGFMRLIEGKEESDNVADTFSDFPNFVYRDNVRDRFYNAVTGIENGNSKRAAFRDEYQDVLNEEMEPLNCEWTADGTIYPDIRETKGGIKLQHNVDLPFAQKKLEPLAALSKQEVRALARYLGIPHLRQPFPGPGLLLRTVGVYSPEKLANEKKANDIVEQEYRKFMLDHYDKEMVIDWKTGLQIPFQTFAATFDYETTVLRDFGNYNSLRGGFLSTNVTGLVDDGEKYERIYKEPFLLFNSPEAPSYISCIDNIQKIINETGSHRVLYELITKDSGNFAVAIRAIDSTDVKKAVPNISGHVPEIAAKRIINEVPDVKTVYFDITPKPPATVEFE